MIKMLRCGVCIILLSLLLTGWSNQVFASEPESEQTQTDPPQSGQIEVPQEGEPGWYQQENYKFYYDKKGKLVTGWMKIAENWYYFMKTDQETAPVGSMATGLTEIRGNRFYFRSSGTMVIGWNKKSNGKFRYFEESGTAGILGRLCVGKKTIGKNTYILNSNGVARTGWISYEGSRYYGQTTKKAGDFGCLYKSGWKKIGGYYYSFTSEGKLKTNRWVGNKFYVDADGKRLTDCVTPDGWIVDEKGKRTVQADGWVKIGSSDYYYENGKAVTGWNRINGKKYYFESDGTMAKSTVVDGIRIDENGVADINASVLIIAGHGQGDPGATSTMGGIQYMEYSYTREFASLIYNRLKAKCQKTQVVMYDQNYDCYQVNAGKKTGPSPNFPNYDYVLEIHFDAAAKDYTGDGVYKGVSILVSTQKKDYALDAAIVKAVVATGFKQYGAGVIARSDLMNMNLCQRLGVSYGLLESAFIDDKDDMTFYNGHKTAMADAVASTIADYFE